MKQRAGWRVDCKWIAGIAFTLSLMAATMAFGVYQSTTIKQTKVIVQVALGEKLEEVIALNYNQIITIAQLNPEQTLPTENMPIKLEIKGKDIAGKSQDELVAYFIDEIATQAYNQNINFEGEASNQQPKEGDMFSSFALSVFNVLNAKTHQFLGTALTAIIAFSLLFLGLLVAFSYRFGRLISPAISFLIVGLSGVAFSLPLRLSAAISQQFSKVVAAPIANFFDIYLTLLATGVVLLTVGVIGNTVLWMLSKKEKVD